MFFFLETYRSPVTENMTGENACGSTADATRSTYALLPNRANNTQLKIDRFTAQFKFYKNSLTVPRFYLFSEQQLIHPF